MYSIRMMRLFPVCELNDECDIMMKETTQTANLLKTTFVGYTTVRDLSYSLSGTTFVGYANANATIRDLSYE